MINPAQDRKVISLQYAFGADMQIPSIFTTGITLISVLLAFYLICLLAMTLYSAWNPRWTATLDSFAMIRIGASISEKVSLLATNHVERMEVLDKTRGWMGNNEEGKRGQLCLRGQQPLDNTKFYVGHETNKLGSSSAQKEKPTPTRRGGYTLASV